MDNQDLHIHLHMMMSHEPYKKKRVELHKFDYYKRLGTFSYYERSQNRMIYYFFEQVFADLILGNLNCVELFLLKLILK